MYYFSNDNLFLVNTFKINNDIEENYKNIIALNETDEKAWKFGVED